MTTALVDLLFALSLLAATLFLGVVALYVVRIDLVLRHLLRTGGEVEKLGWGVRAIASQAALLKEAQRLNRDLTALRDGLRAMDQHLGQSRGGPAA